MTGPALSAPISRRELAFRERAQRIQVGHLGRERRIAVPDRLALLGERIGISEAAGAESERPFVGVGQLREALHRRAFEALVDHLVQSERAALLRAVAVGEGDRRRVELPRHRGLRVALGAVAAGAILLEQLVAAGEVRRLPWARAAPDKRRADAGRARGRPPRRPRGWPWLDQRLEALALGNQRAFAGLAGSAAILSAAEAENSRISAYSDALTTFPSRTAPP